MPFKTILEATILENQNLEIPRDKIEAIASSVYKKAYNDGFDEGFRRGKLIGAHYATRP